MTPALTDGADYPHAADDLDDEGRCRLCGRLPAASAHRLHELLTNPLPHYDRRATRVLMALVAAVALLVGAVLWLVTRSSSEADRVKAAVDRELDTRSAQGAVRFCALVGALPGTDPLLTLVRSTYCPGGKPAPSLTPSPTRTPASIPVPAPSSPETVRIVIPGPASTVTVPGPVRTVTVTPPPAASPSPPQRPPPSPPAPSPTCRVPGLLGGCLIP